MDMQSRIIEESIESLRPTREADMYLPAYVGGGKGDRPQVSLGPSELPRRRDYCQTPFIAI
jgi:hypothetical protein